MFYNLLVHFSLWILIQLLFWIQFSYFSCFRFCIFWSAFVPLFLVPDYYGFFTLIGSSSRVLFWVKLVGWWFDHLPRQRSTRHSTILSIGFICFLETSVKLLDLLSSRQKFWMHFTENLLLLGTNGCGHFYVLSSYFYYFHCRKVMYVVSYCFCLFYMRQFGLYFLKLHVRFWAVFLTNFLIFWIPYIHVFSYTLLKVGILFLWVISIFGCHCFYLIDGLYSCFIILY